MRKIRGTYTNRVYSKVNKCRVCQKEFLISKGYRDICSDNCKRLRLNEYRRKLYARDMELSRERERTKRLKKREVYRTIANNYSRRQGKITREEWKNNVPHGSEHHWWNGGSKTEMTERLNDRNWQKLRVEIWKRDGFRCQHCGQQLAQGIKPITHHIVPWRETKDDSRENLITLCNSCHLKEHHRLRKAAKALA